MAALIPFPDPSRQSQARVPSQSPLQSGSQAPLQSGSQAPLQSGSRSPSGSQSNSNSHSHSHSQTNSNDPEPLWRQLLGDQLRRRRHEREETLTETATKAGVSPQYLSEVERGLKEPSSEMIAAIAGALDATLIDLTSAVADELRSVAVPASAVMSVSRGALALAA